MGALVVGKMAMLILLMMIGYFCAKAKWIDQAFSQKASRIVLNVFTAAMIISSAVNVSSAEVSGNLLFFFWMILLAFLIMALVGWLFSRFLPFSPREGGVAWMSILFMNNIFIGFPVIQALFGQGAVFCASLTNIPFNVLLYSLGVAKLCNTGGARPLRIRQMFSAPLIATLVAVVLFLTRLPVPAVAADTLSTLAGATVPMSMLIIGTSLNSISIKKAVSDWRVYVLSLARLVVCPVLVWLALRTVLDPMLLGIVVVIAGCPCATMLTILSVQLGADDVLASKTIFVSTILSAITLPLVTLLL